MNTSLLLGPPAAFPDTFCSGRAYSNLHHLLARHRDFYTINGVQMTFSGCQALAGKAVAFNLLHLSESASHSIAITPN